MAELIQIATPDGVADGYLARPTGGVPKGGVLFFMDAFGIRPQIADMVDRIASWGYVVLAPNVFYRSGTAAELAPDADLRIEENRTAFFARAGLMEKIAQLTPELAASDARAYVAELDRHIGAEAKLAATGYCMGARLATRVASEFPGRIVAVGGFHGGGLVADDPTSPHNSLVGGTEYLYLHADQDRSMTPERVAELGRALDAVGATYTNEILPGAAHGYTMADTSSWNADAAERHFTELRALLNRAIG